MEIGSGPMSGVYDTVVCLSDFETDDLLCLRMLAARCANVTMRMVVGEGDQDKSSLAAHVLGKYGFTGTSVQSAFSARQSPLSGLAGVLLLADAQVARGTLSDRPYPRDVLGCYDTAPAAAIVDEEAGAFIRRALAESSNPLLVLLKPPLELLALLSEGQADSEASAALLRKAACAVYGSFNFRRVLEVFPQDGEAQLQRLMRSFRVSVVAERSSAVGSTGVFDCSNTDFSVFDESFTGLMCAWNGIAARNLSKSVAEDATALVAASAESDYAAMSKLSVRIARRAGVCRSIGDAQGVQIAAADPIVAALLLNPAVFEPYLQVMEFVINEHDALVWSEPEGSVAGTAPSPGTIYCLTARKGEEQAAVLRHVCSAVNKFCSL